MTAACDGTDGAIDGVVADERLCKFDVATLECPGADGPECLTRPQIRTIKALLAGPKGPTGEQLAQGWPLTNMSLWGQFLGQVAPPWSVAATHENAMRASAGYTMASSLGRAYLGQNFRAEDFDFKKQADLDAWFGATERTGFGGPNTADFRGVQKAGAKIIMWNGRSDPCCGDREMEHYYLDAAKSIHGNVADLSRFARLYLVPGAGHCGSGTGPGDAPDQFLDALINWVEKGKPPGAVVAHGGERVRLQFADPKTGMVSGVMIPPAVGPSRDFLECPYPKIPVYDRRKSSRPGSVYEAANWSCRMPVAPRQS